MLIKKIFESSGSQENGPLALLPAPKCLHPSFYSDSYLGCPSTTWLFHWHYLPTIFSLALFTLWLATVQNWMLVALEKASLHFVNSLQLSKVCPTSILQPVHSLKWWQVITWYKSGTVIGCLPLCRAAVWIRSIRQIIRRASVRIATPIIQHFFFSFFSPTVTISIIYP